MGTTFRLPREFGTVERPDHTALCPKCGGAPITGQDADRDCESCMGYGGDCVAQERYFHALQDVDGELDVTGSSAMFIIQDILNLTLEDACDLYGSIDPTTVLMRCATYFGAARGVIEPSESQAVKLTPEGVELGCRVFNGGRSEAQIERYVVRLRQLAELAIERGAPEICWA